MGTADCTSLRGIRTGLQDLTGSEHQIVYAYEVLGRSFRISRVRNNKSNIPRRYQDEAAGSHEFGTPYRTCLECIRTGLQDLTGSEHQIVYAYEVSGRGFRISRVRNNKSNIPRRYQDEVAGSHEFGTPYRTCLECIRTGLQDLTGSEHQIVHAYEVSGRSCRFSRVRT